MVSIFFLIVFSLLLLVAVPDRSLVRCEIAKRQGVLPALRRSGVKDLTIPRQHGA